MSVFRHDHLLVLVMGSELGAYEKLVLLGLFCAIDPGNRSPLHQGPATRAELTRYTGLSPTLLTRQLGRLLRRRCGVSRKAHSRTVPPMYRIDFPTLRLYLEAHRQAEGTPVTPLKRRKKPARRDDDLPSGHTS